LAIDRGVRLEHVEQQSNKLGPFSLTSEDLCVHCLSEMSCIEKESLKFKKNAGIASLDQTTTVNLRLFVVALACSRGRKETHVLSRVQAEDHGEFQR
jgi:hypothetical protein